jgi:hypothetical protein
LRRPAAAALPEAKCEIRRDLTGRPGVTGVLFPGIGPAPGPVEIAAMAEQMLRTRRRSPWRPAASWRACPAGNECPFPCR